MGSRRFEQQWQIEARKQGRLQVEPATQKSGDAFKRSRDSALRAWVHIVAALNASERVEDRQLAMRIRGFVLDTPYAKGFMQPRHREAPVQRDPIEVGLILSRDRQGPEISR